MMSELELPCVLGLDTYADWCVNDVFKFMPVYRRRCLLYFLHSSETMQLDNSGCQDGDGVVRAKRTAATMAQPYKVAPHRSIAFRTAPSANYPVRRLACQLR